MNIERISFTNLVPFAVIVEKHAKSPRKIKEYFVAGIRKKLRFYAVNQSEKFVHMIRWDEIEIDTPPFYTRIYGKEKEFYVSKGEMLPLAKVHQFDKLFKGVLNEIDLFEDIGDLHELIEYQLDLRLFHIHAGDSQLTSPLGFNNIGYAHIFIEAKDPKAAEELLQAENSKKLNKQDQRELVFIEWLKDKDELVVSNMMKDEVWEELRNIDRRLFAADSKTFFRIQQIIKFKSGRKTR